MQDDARLRAEFLKYGELEDPAAQTGFLASLRASDPELASRLERLIAAAAIDDSFLEVPAVRSWHKVLAESDQRREQTESNVAQLMTQLQGAVSGELRFGTYELRRLIKTSTEAMVFEGYDPQVQRQVAIKCLMPSSIEDPGRRDRILSEARSLARVRDPHVLSVLAVLEQQELRAILLPWIQGPTLDTLLSNPQPIETERAIRIALGLIQGVTAVHRAGIVHRDLKPSNIVLDESDDRPVIVDFGLACDDSDLDESMLLCGTPQVMAPELIRGGRPSAATDRFALGCVLYQLFTRVRPFQGDSIEQVFRQILESQPAAPAKHMPEMPAEVEQALLGLLQKDPVARPDSLAEIRSALEKWSAAIQLSTSCTSNDSASSFSRRSRRRVWQFAVAIAVVPITTMMIGGWKLIGEQVPQYRPLVERTVPRRPPDRDLHWPTSDQSPFLNSVENVFVTQEKTLDQVRYWRPSQPGQWGQIVMLLPVENTREIEYAQLDATIEVFGMLDLSAQATLDIRGIGQTQWLRVDKVGPGQPKLGGAGFAMDVTDLCRQWGGVELRARLYATRIIHSPGPTDPVGPASAQFLRDAIDPRGERGTLCVKVWEKAD